MRDSDISNTEFHQSLAELGLELQGGWIRPIGSDHPGIAAIFRTRDGTMSIRRRQTLAAARDHFDTGPLSAANFKRAAREHMAREVRG